jgi:hypothetical protein
LSRFFDRTFSVLLLGFVGACHSRPDISRKPSKACRDAEQSLAQAVALHYFAQARSLRPAAYAACGPRLELRAQDQRIVDGEASQRLAEADLERRERELAAALHAFLDFVAAFRLHPERASVRPVCEQAPIRGTLLDGGAAPDGGSAPGGRTVPGGGSPARFCVAKRSLGGLYPIEVRYEEANPKTFRFTINVEGAVDCRAAGGTEEQSWHVQLPGGETVWRSRCALGGALTGLKAVVSASVPSSVHVVSPAYFERDLGARRALTPL